MVQNSNTAKGTMRVDALPPVAVIKAGSPLKKEKKLGEYILLDKIGEGEFSYVYKAMGKEEKFYAIKILKPGLSKEDCELFDKEAQKLQDLRHRTLPRFQEKGISKPQDGFHGMPYIVMEYIEGKTLEEISQGQTSLDNIFRWLYQLAQGLQYLHTCGIVHRDIKPSNIKVTYSSSRGNNLYILDLGIAEFQTQSHSVSLGTLQYMSPERFSREKATAASDVYSFGLVAYQLLEGKYPYAANGSKKIEEWKRIHLSLKPQSFKPNSIPSDIAEMVYETLSKNPQERPKMEKVVEILGKKVVGVGMPSHIGILGARGAGKTCYLVSLYGVATSDPQTQAILEPMFMNLYQGECPYATEKIVSRLGFQIDTEKKSYSIITKDYGGEMLRGRLQKSHDSEALREIIEQKEEEIYEFFANSRGILILLETAKEGETLQRQIDCRNEVEHLINKISTMHQGKRQLPMPIALVLSKWDRQGEISWNPEKEKARALEYIKKSHWNIIYQKLSLVSSKLEVFPVFSFIGDKPSKEDIRSFNLLAPLTYLASTAEECLWERASLFETEHPQEYPLVLENYYRLLYAENIQTPEITKKAKAAIERISELYLASLEKQSKNALFSQRFILANYKELLQTKGISVPVWQKAQAQINKLEDKMLWQKCKMWIYGILVFFAMLYGIKEYIAYGNVYNAMLQMQMGTLEIPSCMEIINKYYQSEGYNPLRKGYFSPKVSEMVSKVSKETWAKEIQYFLSWNLPSPPSQKLNFSKNDIDSIQEKIKEANENLSTIQEHKKKGQNLQIFRKRWQEFLKTAWTDQVSEKINQVQSIEILWQKYLRELKQIESCFLEWKSQKENMDSIQQNFSFSFSQDKRQMLSSISSYLSQVSAHLEKLERLDSFLLSHVCLSDTPCPFHKDIPALRTQIASKKELWCQKKISLSLAKEAYQLVSESEKQLEKMISKKVSTSQDFSEIQKQSLSLQKEIVQASLALQKVSESARKNSLESLGTFAQMHSQELLDDKEKLILQNSSWQQQWQEILAQNAKQYEKELEKLEIFINHVETFLKKDISLEALEDKNGDLKKKFQESTQNRISSEISEEDRKKFLSRQNELQEKLQNLQQEFGVRIRIEKILHEANKLENTDYPDALEKQISKLEDLQEELKNLNPSTFSEQKRNALSSLKSKQREKQSLKRDVESEESKIKTLLGNYRQRIQGSYSEIQQELELIQKEAKTRPYLQNKYDQKFIDAGNDIKEIKKKDFNEYQEIDTAIRERRFFDASKKTNEYLESSHHQKIMEDEIKDYWQNFTCTLEIDIYLTPSNDFDDESDGPEFRLAISHNNNWVPQKTSTITTQNNLPNGQRTLITKFTCTINLQNYHELSIELIELDTMTPNDNYGTINFRLKDLLNQYSIEKTQICYGDQKNRKNREGDLTITLERYDITVNIPFPKWKEKTKK